MKNFRVLYSACLVLCLSLIVIFSGLKRGTPLHEDDMIAGQEYEVVAVHEWDSFESDLLMYEVKKDRQMITKYYLIHKEGSETFVRGNYRCVLENGKKKLVLIKASADLP